MDFFRGLVMIIVLTGVFYCMNFLFIFMKAPEVYPAMAIALFILLIVEIMERLDTIIELLKKDK